jgi:hypothetical protein
MWIHMLYNWWKLIISISKNIFVPQRLLKSLRDGDCLIAKNLIIYLFWYFSEISCKNKFNMFRKLLKSDKMNEMNELVYHFQYLGAAAFIFNDAPTSKNQIQTIWTINLFKSKWINLPRNIFLFELELVRKIWHSRVHHMEGKCDGNAIVNTFRSRGDLHIWIIYQNNEIWWTIHTI